MNLRESIDLTDGQERSLTRLLQLVLAGICAYGLYAGNMGIAVNAAGAIAVSFLPALLRREYHLRMDPGVTLLITTAVLLHAIGFFGLYDNTAWWDTVTHAFSGLVATGIGYAVLNAIDRYTDAIYIPDRYHPIFMLIFALAVGVLWEIVEFAATKLSSLYGGRSVLIIYGPVDIVTDLVFTAAGGLILALWGTRYFRGLSRKLAGVLAR